MRKIRHTLQREIVYQAILSMPGHVTADMVYEEIHAAHPSISRATVYRNLRMLEAEGRIMRIDVPGSADCFEARTREHYHIRCASCGKLFDAKLKYMPRLIELERAADSEFEICACNLLFVGYCPDCREKRAEEEKEDEQVQEENNEQ